MSAALGEGGHTPYRPWSDDVPMEDEDGILYAVAAKVPVCAIWNLLDDGSATHDPSRVAQLPARTFSDGPGEDAGAP